MTLTEFLLARISEGDRAMRAVKVTPPSIGPRWLVRWWPRWAKLAAAAVYADHPDYREEWRP